MALLDDLSGYDFEDLMEDVFRNLGYENVHQSGRTADEGRDILMEEVVNGQRRAVVVECKHTDTVSRPVVQKLHSAVATYEYDGPVRGMVATTGRFTEPAREYADRVGEKGTDGIELLDGRDLRKIGDEIGLDLYNGRIEILCEEALRPTHPTADQNGPLLEVTSQIKNLDPSTLSTPGTAVSFEPMVIVAARTSAVFETSVGVIHQLDETDDLVIHADRGKPRVADSTVQQLVSNRNAPRIDITNPMIEQQFDSIDRKRFGQTETEYKTWAVDTLRERHTTTAHYTGKNNVDYQKTCQPRQSDVTVDVIDPVYLPHVRSRLSLEEYRYNYAYYSSGPSRATTTNEFDSCVHCDSTSGPRTYCANCGSINCPSHTKTERLEGEPICSGCAVTERFTLKTKYFYNEKNLEEFREEYAAMAIHEKALENPVAVAGAILTACVAFLFVASAIGIF